MSKGGEAEGAGWVRRSSKARIAEIDKTEEEERRGVRITQDSSANTFSIRVIPNAAPNFSKLEPMN